MIHFIFVAVLWFPCHLTYTMRSIVGGGNILQGACPYLPPATVLRHVAFQMCDCDLFITHDEYDAIPIDMGVNEA